MRPVRGGGHAAPTRLGHALACSVTERYTPILGGLLCSARACLLGNLLSKQGTSLGNFRCRRGGCWWCGRWCTCGWNVPARGPCRDGGNPRRGVDSGGSSRCLCCSGSWRHKLLVLRRVRIRVRRRVVIMAWLIPRITGFSGLIPIVRCFAGSGVGNVNHGVCRCGGGFWLRCGAWSLSGQAPIVEGGSRSVC